ncbi:MAG: hypothetical protein ACUVX1_06875 [Chloroflexota bacterium]
MNYRHSTIGVANPSQVLCELLTDILSQQGKPWWAPLSESALLGFDSPRQQDWWDNASAVERARWLVDQLWSCQERLPWEFCDNLELPRASTCAQAVRRLWSDLLEHESPISA